jgi:hypothetical protein
VRDEFPPSTETRIERLEVAVTDLRHELYLAVTSLRAHAEQHRDEIAVLRRVITSLGGMP